MCALLPLIILENFYFLFLFCFLNAPSHLDPLQVDDDGEPAAEKNVLHFSSSSSDKSSTEKLNVFIVCDVIIIFIIFIFGFIRPNLRFLSLKPLHFSPPKGHTAPFFCQL